MSNIYGFPFILQWTKYKHWSATNLAWLLRIPMRRIMLLKNSSSLLLLVQNLLLFSLISYSGWSVDMPSAIAHSVKYFVVKSYSWSFTSNWGRVELHLFSPPHFCLIQIIVKYSNLVFSITAESPEIKGNIMKGVKNHWFGKILGLKRFYYELWLGNHNLC